MEQAYVFNLIFQLLILIFSVVIHEVSHGVMAYNLGDSTAKDMGRLTLNPIPHLSFMGMVVIPIFTFLIWGIPVGSAKPVPYNPYNLRNQKWGPAMVAAAGPASNLVVAFVFGMIIRASIIFNAPPVILDLIPFFIIIVALNVLLAVINLVPIPPIDGSKIVFPMLPVLVRQKLMSRWYQVRPLFTQYWILLLILFIFFGRQILFLLFAIVNPVMQILFVLITGLPSPF